jgi:hypothetical protein
MAAKEGPVSSRVFAVVEIADHPMLLLIGAVFIATFVAVCAVAYLIAKRRSNTPAGTWEFQLHSRLPVSNRTFERLSRAAATATKRPDISPATRAQLDQLGQLRSGFVSFYRVVMIFGGLAGLTAGALLLRSHTPANMNGLPGGIFVLLSLGALLNGVMPGPSIKPSVGPLEPALREELKEKINVQVMTSPLRVTLSESDMQLAIEMHRRGAPIADVAHAVHPGYKALSEVDRQSVESAIAHAVQQWKTA